MHIRAVVHAVLPMEMDGCGVVPAEEIEGVDGLVLVTEESPHTLSLLVVDAAETQRGDFFIFLHDGLVDKKVLHSVLARVLIGLCPCHAMCHHGVANLESRVDDNAVVAVEHLGIHSSH